MPRTTISWRPEGRALFGGSQQPADRQDRDHGGPDRGIRERARTVKPGGWIVGRGYDDTLLREKRHPTRGDLDQVSTEHPVWITHISGHLGSGNSKALALANITRATPQPRGGRIRKDPATGEPNGGSKRAANR